MGARGEEGMGREIYEEIKEGDQWAGLLLMVIAGGLKAKEPFHPFIGSFPSLRQADAPASPPAPATAAAAPSTVSPPSLSPLLPVSSCI
jgi:hypothetical protein